MKLRIFLLGIFFTLLSLSIFSDCIDSIYDDDSPEQLERFLKYGKAILASIPQKITKTIQGITFDSNYDNGSLQNVVEAGTNIFTCTIFEEPGALGTRKYWFRFKMTGTAGRKITLNIDHSQNPYPVVSFDGKTWRRLTTAEAPSTSQIVLTFTQTQNFAELAFFFPLGVEETYTKINDLVRDKDFVTTKVIGQSFQKRDMWMVTITDPTVPDTNKYRVWFHSRAHAGEVTSTHVILGIIEQASENTRLGRHLRKHCIFNIVPLLNVDGVHLGHTRWDSQGYDPERDWCTPTTLPEVLNMKNQVDTFMAGENQIRVALNLHSTQGNYTDTFFFKHIRPSVTANFEVIQQNYINAFKNATPLFNNLSAQTSQLAPCIFIESYFWNNWKETVMAMTHEGHFYRRITDNAWITDDDYRLLGKAQAVALIEYFNLPEPSNYNLWILY